MITKVHEHDNHYHFIENDYQSKCIGKGFTKIGGKRK